MRVFNLTPSVPLSFKGEGEEKEREAVPLSAGYSPVWDKSPLIPPYEGGKD